MEDSSRRYFVVVSAASGAVLTAAVAWIVWSMLHPIPMRVRVRLDVVGSGTGQLAVRPEEFTVYIETNRGDRIPVQGSSTSVEVEIPPSQKIRFTPDRSDMNGLIFHYSAGCNSATEPDCVITAFVGSQSMGGPQRHLSIQPNLPLPSGMSYAEILSERATNKSFPALQISGVSTWSQPPPQTLQEFGLPETATGTFVQLYVWAIHEDYKPFSRQIAKSFTVSRVNGKAITLPVQIREADANPFNVFFMVSDATVTDFVVRFDASMTGFPSEGNYDIDVDFTTNKAVAYRVR